MRRFFVPSQQVSADSITILGSDVAHIRDSLRLKPGDEITVSDGIDTEYQVELTELARERVTGRIKCTRKLPPSSVRLTLVQALPKANKGDLIVEKCTEIGLSHIAFVPADRSVAVSGPSKIQNRLSRWKRIAREASKQCRRIDIPAITVLPSLESAFELLDNDHIALVGAESGGIRIGEALQRRPDSRKVCVFIGPEGGFSEQEMERLDALGADRIWLGERILRTETAGIIASALILYEMGDLG